MDGLRRAHLLQRLPLSVSGGPRYHVLLIGIDAYTVRGLRGCVNDIDAVQSLLIERAKIPAGSIKRLASPGPGTKHPTVVPEAPATLANIRAALAELGAEKVANDDRVLIYYSGHGAQVALQGPQGTFHRESIVPVDFNEDNDRLRFLFDFEINRLLAAIASRTTSVCVILDCCHSAGVSRTTWTERWIDVGVDLKKKEPLEMPPEQAQEAGAGQRGIGGRVSDCQIVAACQNNQVAQEHSFLPGSAPHGLLTNALLTELARIPDAELHAVPWTWIWERIRGSVTSVAVKVEDRTEQRPTNQEPSIYGNLGRAVLAGPNVERDPGLSLKRTPGTNEYMIDAGALAGVDVGARLAVYGEGPAFFPEIGSPADLSARASRSLLQVIRADRTSAVAVCAGEPFDLPPGARARLVGLAPEAALICAVVPRDERLEAQISGSPMLRVAGESEAEVRLVQQEGGAWALTDDLHGARPEFSALFTLPAASGPYIARPVLEHYLSYAQPLRMAARCVDLPGALRISLLECPSRGLSEAEAQGRVLPEVPSHPVLTYALKDGDAFCVQVLNTSSRPLRVTLANCAATGKVELCGDEVIQPRSFHRFWNGGRIGNPFVAWERNASVHVDRMVAIGTTRLGADLGYLRSDRTFSDVVEAHMIRGGFKPIPVDGRSTPPIESWTAAQATLAIEGKSAARGEADTRGSVTPVIQPSVKVDPAEAAGAPLRCAIVPPDETLKDLLEGSPVLRTVSEDEAEVFLSRLSDNRWLISDDVGMARRGYPALVTLLPEQLHHARDVLELYYRYARPLRMASHSTDLPGALKVTLLACPAQGVSPGSARRAALREVPASRPLAFALAIGDAFCVEVDNTSDQPLRVTLLNCAASGKVEDCGNEIVAARSRERFWCGEPGCPFIASEVRGNRRYVDRMVAIGTTLLNENFGYLQSDVRFSDILDTRGRASPPVDTSPPRGKWTASEIALEIGLPGENG